MSKESKEVLQSKNVFEFITVANEVCIFLEEIGKYNLGFMLAYLQKVLPLLYLKGSMIPDVEVENEEGNERFVTIEQWESIYLGVLDKTGEKDIFPYVTSSTDADGSEGKGSIAENLADIYQDLKDFILLFQKNTISAKENAVHACKMLFQSNWGIKTLATQLAIHNMLCGKPNDNNDLYKGLSPN